MQRLGQVLASRHRVTILDGGRALPFPNAVLRLEVPRLARVDGRITPLDSGLSPQAALDQRTAILDAYIAAEPPDAIVVEHYPFSKWELEEEVLRLVSRARHANPAVRVISSLRDISPATRHEAGQAYTRRVLDALHTHFDALLVHADPRLCTLADSFPASSDIRLPVHHTGLVTAGAQAPPPARRQAADLSGGYAVASVGGGSDRAGLAERVTKAWHALRARGALDDMTLLLFGGLDGRAEQEEPAWPATAGSIVPMGFAADFRQWLGGARLSVSCAGYNTCADLLVAGTSALLIPNTFMSDQAARASMLDRRGAATLVPEPEGGEDQLGRMMLSAMRRPRADHGIALDGARRSLDILETLSGGL